MFIKSQKITLVLLAAFLVIMRSTTGAPGSQVEFKQIFNSVISNSQVKQHSPINTQTLKIPIDKTYSTQSSKNSKSTYKKYPKPDSFTVVEKLTKAFTKIEISSFFNNSWKLYVLPLVTRAQDPPASRKTEIHTYINLADSKGFTFNERNGNLRTWRLSV